MSLDWLEELQEIDWPWYLAVQDGMEPDDVWDIVFQKCPRIHGIFLGGTNDFKKTASYWCQMSHAIGIKFHYARAGTVPKIIHARSVGADSIDTSFPLWTMSRLNSFIQLLNQPNLVDHKESLPAPSGDGGMVNL